MADLYVADSVYAQYVTEYGDDAKHMMQQMLERNAPGDTDE